MLNSYPHNNQIDPPLFLLIQLSVVPLATVLVTITTVLTSTVLLTIPRGDLIFPITRQLVVVALCLEGITLAVPLVVVVAIDVAAVLDALGFVVVSAVELVCVRMTVSIWEDCDRKRKGRRTAYVVGQVDIAGAVAVVLLFAPLDVVALLVDRRITSCRLVIYRWSLGMRTDVSRGEAWPKIPTMTAARAMDAFILVVA